MRSSVRLLTFAARGRVRLGAQLDDEVIALSAVDPSLPDDMLQMIALGDRGVQAARDVLIRAAANELPINEPYRFPLSAIVVLAPLPTPRRNVFCIGHNYQKHVDESQRRRAHTSVRPDFPEVFTKPGSTVVGPSHQLVVDLAATAQLDYEVELAVVIGRRGRNVTRDAANSFVFGYTIANDISERTMQHQSKQWFKGKAVDYSCPIGPVLVPAVEIPHVALGIRLRVNGELRQDSNTREMIWGVEELVSYVSQGTTLEVGDIILTGTPEGVGHRMTPPQYIRPGDVMQAEIDDIGVLQTYVVS